MFIIIETVQSNDVAIGFVDDSCDFKKYIQNYKHELGSKYIENIMIEDLEKDDYDDGHYLIKCTDNKVLILINKHRQINNGWLYNSTTIYTDEVARWMILPFTEYQATIESDSTDNELDHTFLDYDLLDTKQINDSLIGIIGQSEFNKTLIIDSLLRSKSQKYLQDSLIVTTNDEYYKLHFPSINVIKHFDNAMIKEYLKKEDGCVIINDMNVPHKIKDSAWSSFFYNFNPDKLRIVTVDKSHSFQLKIKKQINYTFYLKSNDEKEITKAWNYDGQYAMQDMDKFKNTFEQMTDNCGAVVFKRINENLEMYRYNTTYKLKLD
jgi:hypothetical protein